MKKKKKKATESARATSERMSKNMERENVTQCYSHTKIALLNNSRNSTAHGKFRLIDSQGLFLFRKMFFLKKCSVLETNAQAL